MVLVKVKKLGTGKENDPIRPDLTYVDTEGNTHEYGKDVPGITYLVAEEGEDYVLIEVDEKTLERMKSDGINILQ